MPHHREKCVPRLVVEEAIVKVRIIVIYTFIRFDTSNIDNARIRIVRHGG